MIKAVIFDFGRVISAQKPSSLFRRYEEDLGLAPDTLNPIMFGDPAWDDAQLGRTSADKYWRRIGPKLGLETRQEIEAFRRRYHADEAANPEVVELIRLLRGRYRLAVLSNSPPGLGRWLDEWGLRELFDVVFCSGDEGIMKPDRRAFETVLERLGAAPSEAVFIDDDPGHVEAARRLGLRGILFATARQLSEELAPLLDPG